MEAIYHSAEAISLPAAGPIFYTAAHPLYHSGPKGSLWTILELQFHPPPCQRQRACRLC